MTYELAKKLKDAGFPQEAGENGNRVLSDSEGENEAIVPTLEELIEACGPEFRWLKNKKTFWFAQQRQHPNVLGDMKTAGKTPSEAVARLWLALNKKDGQ